MAGISLRLSYPIVAQRRAWTRCFRLRRDPFPVPVHPANSPHRPADPVNAGTDRAGMFPPRPNEPFGVATGKFFRADRGRQENRVQCLTKDI